MCFLICSFLCESNASIGRFVVLVLIRNGLLGSGVIFYSYNVGFKILDFLGLDLNFNSMQEVRV